MAFLNKVFLMGDLGKDHEIKPKERTLTIK